MNNTSVIKADDPKITEIGAVSSGKEGSKPRTIRMRGYYRALKREEPWAIFKRNQTNILNNLAAGFYNKMTEPSAFFGLLDREKLEDDDKSLPVISGFNAWLPTETD